ERRLDPEALVPALRAAPAARERPALLDGQPQVALDAVALPRRDHGAADRPVVEGVTGAEPRQRPGGDLDGLVVAVAGDEDPGRDRAALPGVGDPGERRVRAGGLQVGVVQDDERRL